jgi:hypothetical protein
MKKELRKTAKSSSRQTEKTVDFAVGLIIIALVVCAGVGLGCYALSQIYNLETRQNQARSAYVAR